MSSHFAGTLRASFKKTNRQLPELLKVFLALCLYFLGDFLFLGILIFAGYFLHGFLQFLFGLLAGLAIIWILIKINGAIGVATAMLASGSGGNNTGNSPADGRISAREIARQSYKRGTAFFWNGLTTGVVLFFGQLLLVCPCFFLLNNFLFSPHLFVYENIRGRAAKKRSVELARGFSWEILNRTAGFIFVGYIFLVLVAMLLYTKIFWLAGILILVSGIYLAQLQSNYIYEIYRQTLVLQQAGVAPARASGRFKIVTGLTILVLIVIYVAIHLIPTKK